MKNTFCAATNWINLGGCGGVKSATPSKMVSRCVGISAMCRAHPPLPLPNQPPQPPLIQKPTGAMFGSTRRLKRQRQRQRCDRIQFRSPPRPHRLSVDDKEEPPAISRTPSANTPDTNHDDTGHQENIDLDQTPERSQPSSHQPGSPSPDHAAQQQTAQTAFHYSDEMTTRYFSR